MLVLLFFRSILLILQYYFIIVDKLYVEYVSNDDVLQQTVQSIVLLERIKSEKLRYFGHAACHLSLQNSIVLGYMPGAKE